jgi:site-specific recombinase XerD
MELVTLRAAHEAHLQARTRLRRAPSTVRGYRHYIGRFIEFLEERSDGSLGLEMLNVDQVGDFQDWLRARNSCGHRGGAAAEYNAVRFLKTFSRWLWRRGYVPIDPLLKLEVPRLPKLRRQPYTEAEVRALVAAAAAGQHPVLERALLLIGLDTGARIGELCAAELSDLNLELGSILFRPTKFNHTRLVFFGVPDAEDGGPCTQALREWLAQRGTANSSTLFLDPHGEPLTTDQARRIYKALGRSAGVEHCIPHRGRHTHASELLAELPGAEIQLRHRLGHLSPEVLADYVSISDKSAREIAGVASLSAKWHL